MFARISTYHGAPNKTREASRIIGEITPEMQQMKGFQRAYLLVDGKSGKSYSISLWGTEEETNKSTPAAAHIRDKISQALGANGKPTVEIFEVGAEIVHHLEGGRFARVSEYHGTPSRVDDVFRTAKETESALKGMQGFHHALFFADRKTGKALSMTFWESETALSRSSSAANPLRDKINQSTGGTGHPTVEMFEVAGDIPQRARKAA